MSLATIQNALADTSADMTTAIEAILEKHMREFAAFQQATVNVLAVLPEQKAVEPITKKQADVLFAEDCEFHGVDGKQHCENVSFYPGEYAMHLLFGGSILSSMFRIFNHAGIADPETETPVITPYLGRIVGGVIPEFNFKNCSKLDVKTIKCTTDSSGPWYDKDIVVSDEPFMQLDVGSYNQSTDAKNLIQYGKERDAIDQENCANATDIIEAHKSRYNITIRRYVMNLRVVLSNDTFTTGIARTQTLNTELELQLAKHAADDEVRKSDYAARNMVLNSKHTDYICVVAALAHQENKLIERTAIFKLACRKWDAEFDAVRDGFKKQKDELDARAEVLTQRQAGLDMRDTIANQQAALRNEKNTLLETYVELQKIISDAAFDPTEAHDRITRTILKLKDL